MQAERQAQLQNLAAWLKANHPADVLMPVAKGGKAPLLCHRGGSWTWAQYDALDKSKDVDYAIILQELAVIDVDSEEQARSLAERFPALRVAPRESTRRGMHFFFARSTRCDVEGYYDGAGQVERGIDFKSVSRSGTGGIIVVGPSTDKVWQTPLQQSSAPAPIIPDDLLCAVAKPSHLVADATLTFHDGVTLAVTGCRWLLASEFCATQLLPRWSKAAAVGADVDAAGGGAGSRGSSSSSSAGGGGTMSVGASRGATGVAVVPPPTLAMPCSCADFVELVHVLDTGELSPATAPTVSNRARLYALGDMLLMPKRLIRCLRSGVGRLSEKADLFAADDAWWRADAEEGERARATSAAAVAASDAALVRVDAALARTLRYVPLPKDDMWLFQPLSTTFRADEAGTRVLRADPVAALRACLPAPVLDVLNRYRACAVLAGGAVTGATVARAGRGNDFDLFLYGVSAEQAEAVLAEIEAAHAGGNFAVYRTAKATTFAVRGASAADATTWQVIHRLFRGRAQVLESFDLQPCKALARIDGAGALVVEALPSWCLSQAHMAFYVDSELWNYASVARVLKYVAKGYECFVPGTRRSAFLDSYGIMRDADSSLRGLFDAEAEVLASRARAYESPTRRLTAGEAVRFAVRLGHTSDYHSFARVTGRLVYIVRALAITAMRAAGLAGRRRAAAVKPVSRVWSSADFSKRITAYGPQDVGLKKLYDMARIPDALDDDAVAAGAVALAASAEAPAAAAEAAAAAVEAE